MKSRIQLLHGNAYVNRNAGVEGLFPTESENTINNFKFIVDTNKYEIVRCWINLWTSFSSGDARVVIKNITDDTFVYDKLLKGNPNKLTELKSDDMTNVTDGNKVYQFQFASTASGPQVRCRSFMVELAIKNNF